MGKLVSPETYHIGYTVLNMPEMERYLKDTGNEAFLEDITNARHGGLSDGEILTSFYAKLCYSSLTLGKNDNITKIRDIPGNLRASWDQAHGSVWEHVALNFVAHNCSRIYEIEQVRHRVGVAYSILSGRYFRSDSLNMVPDPILQKYGILSADEQFGVHNVLEQYMLLCSERIEKLEGSFDLKKKLTSAMRRWLPQGRATEVGFSLNLRSLRHIIQMRTSRGAEWEIRLIYNQVYKLIKDKYPLLFHGAKEEIVDDLIEVSGMRMQPYDKTESN